MPDLVVRSIFPTQPGEDVGEAFRRHLAETGQPETFPGISTACPPKQTHMVVLVHPFHVDRNKRPERDMAPCPICSPSKEKFLDGGSLIWCEATQAIYAIGPDCSETLWEDGRLNRAVNEFKRTEAEKARAEHLQALVTMAPAVRDWIARHREPSAKVETHQVGLAASAPRLRSSLWNALKAASAATAHIEGHRFLGGRWRLTSELAKADTGLANLASIAGSDPESWVKNLSPTIVSQRLALAKDSVATVKKVHDRMKVASQFLSKANCERLAMWGKSGAAPVLFTASRTESTVDIRAGQERWVGPIAIPPPADLPPGVK